MDVKLELVSPRLRALGVPVKKAKGFCRAVSFKGMVLVREGSFLSWTSLGVDDGNRD